MASTASSKRSRHLLGLALLAPALAWGGDWKVTPSLTLSELYSDNPDLAGHGQEQSDWITEISPRVMVRREGARMNVQADYMMTGLLYASESSRNDILHRLNGKAAAELVEDWFYLDATARISQQLKQGAAAGDAGVVGIGGKGGLGGAGGVGITGVNNTTQVGGYSLSPYLKHRFGSFATVEARVAQENTFSGDSGVSDGSTTRYRLSAVSGNDFYPLSWNASYTRSDTGNNNGVGDTSDDRADFKARYSLSREFGLTAQAGMEKHDFDGADGDMRDYQYYGLGVFYTPSRRFAMDASYNHSNSDNGNFLSGSVTLNPTLRTSLRASASQRAYGHSYGLDLTHRTRQSNWSLRYHEDITTSQQQFLNYQGSVFVYSCPNGTVYQQPGDPPPSDPNCVPLGVQNYFNQSQQNETYVSKMLTGTVSYTRRRSTWLLSVYNNRRQYQSGGGDEETWGLQASWNLKASADTTLILSGGLSTEDNDDGSRSDDLWNLGLAITHQFQAKVSGSVALRHQERDSNQAGDSYEENSAAVRLSMSF
jgi:uncharacterized protein (PEP-CTERM system associated)